MPSSIVHLSVTFLADVPVGIHTFRTGDTVSLPEGLARSFGDAVRINGLGSVASAPGGALSSSDVDLLRPMAGQVVMRLPKVVGSWEVPLPPHAAANSTAIPAVNVLYFLPVHVAEEIQINKFGIRVSTGGAGSSFKFALWANSGRRPVGLPLLAYNAGVDTSASGPISVTFPSVAVPRGWSWIGYVFTGTLPAVKAMAPTNPYAGCVVGGPTLGDVLPSGTSSEFAGYSTPQAYATDISTVDVTAAALTRLTAASVPIPAWNISA